MAASVADMVEAVGVNDPAHAGIIASFKKQMNAVRTVQEPDGAFHTILNDKNTYVEMSATAALGYAALKGVRLSLLDGEFEDGRRTRVEGRLVPCRRERDCEPCIEWHIRVHRL